MLTKLVALGIVLLLAGAPVAYLFRAAWARGGVARRVAVAALCVAGALTVWLLAPIDAGPGEEDHLSQAIGAFGIFIACVGILAFAAYAVGRAACT